MIHVYHCWTDGSWQRPLLEHFAALSESGFDGRIEVSIVGNNPAAASAIAELLDGWPTPIGIRVAALAGTEAVSVNLCRTRARDQGESVMYAHTKGAAHDDALHDSWRREMTHKLVRHWRVWERLTARFDVVAPFSSMVGEFRGGNYWVGAARHLSRLPLCEEDDAERWVMFGEPLAYDCALADLP